MAHFSQGPYLYDQQPPPVPQDQQYYVDEQQQQHQQQYYYADQQPQQQQYYYTDQQQPYATPPPPPPSPPPEGPPLQWLHDRIEGQSKYGNQERPPCPCCWVPPPVGWCPGLLETNFCCRWWGWVGCFPSELARCWCLNVGLLLNLCGLVLTAYACIAISDDYVLLTKASFQELRLTEVSNNGGGSSSSSEEVVELFVGLKAAALNNEVSGVGQIVVPFDQFCDLVGLGLERYMNPKDCNKCQEVSESMVIALMISVATFLPTFLSEQLRLYSGYDSNCVKSYVTILGVLTILLNLSVIFGYVYGCSAFFYSGQVLFDANGDVLPSNTPVQDATFDTQYDWEWGYAFVALVAGTVCKFLDVLFNAVIPTPVVTRDKKEQEIYESIGGEELEAIQQRAKPQEPQKVQPGDDPVPPGADA